MKLTKRKGFNFFRSYYDVYNLLPDEDKIAFMDALLDRQFLGIKPTELTGMSEFAYVSQTNSIDSQVKGYEDKTRTKLNPLEVNNYTPTVGVNEKVLTPSLQVQVEEEVKEKEKEVTTIYKKFVVEVKEGRHQQATDQMYMRLRIKQGTLTPLLKNFYGQMIIDNAVPKNTLELRKHFNNWLNVQDRVGKLDEYKK